MKILEIHNFIRPYIDGGASISVEKVARSLSENKEVEVVLITTYDKFKTSIEKYKNLKIYKIYPLNLYFGFPPKKKINKFFKILWWIINLWNPFVFFQIRKILKIEKPTIVHVHALYSLSFSVISAVKSLKIPVIYTDHAYFGLCINSGFSRPLKGICLKQCTLCKLWSSWNKIFLRRNVSFIFLSKFAHSLYERTLKLKLPMRVLHNSSFFSKEEIENIYKIKKEKLKNKEKLIFLFIGFLEFQKGIVAAIEAFKRSNLKKSELWIIGKGRFKNYVEHNVKLDRRIKYFGYIENEKIKEIALDSHVLLFPSEFYEGSPTTIQEAYAYGLPIIATDLGSITEHIKVGETGFLFKYKNINELSKLMEWFENNMDEIDKFSENCFKVALSNCKEEYIRKYLELIKDCLNTV